MSKSIEPDGPCEAIPIASKYVIEAVAVLNRVSLAEIRGNGRSMPLCLARHTCQFLMHDRLGLSYPQIGRIMRRNHASALQGCRKVRRLMLASPMVAEMVDRAWDIAVEAAHKDGGLE